MPVLLGWRSSAGDSAQARQTLTAWRRLSFSRSLSDGTRVTRGFLAASGILCTGKGQSWVSPKPPLLSHQAALPESCLQPRRHLSPAGELCSPIWLWLQHPPAYPSNVCTHSSFSAWELQQEEKQRQAPLPPSPWAEADACTALPPGEGHRGRTKRHGAGQSCCPSPGSLCPATAPALALPFWGSKGDQGMQDAEMPPIPPFRHAARSLPRLCTEGRGPSQEPLLPGRGTWHHDSPESGSAGAPGPEEDEGAPLLAAADTLHLFLPRRLLPVTQHPQLVQGQAELWAQGGATSAESRGRQ